MNSSTMPKMVRYSCALIWLRMRCSNGLSEVDRGRPGQALGHEVAREIELLVGAQDVVELPLGAQRRRQRRLIVEVMIHLNSLS